MGVAEGETKSISSPTSLSGVAMEYLLSMMASSAERLEFLVMAILLTLGQ
jgi:hypothetical protein